MSSAPSYSTKSVTGSRSLWRLSRPCGSSGAIRESVMILRRSDERNTSVQARARGGRSRGSRRNGQLDRECRALARRAVDAELAAVIFDDLARQRQAEPV